MLEKAKESLAKEKISLQNRLAQSQLENDKSKEKIKQLLEYNAQAKNLEVLELKLKKQWTEVDAEREKLGAREKVLGEEKAARDMDYKKVEELSTNLK